MYQKTALKVCTSLVFFCFMMMVSNISYASPLVTEDTGSQGKGKFQLELSTEFTFDKETRDLDGDGLVDGIKMKSTVASVSFTYGITENIDIAIETPYMRSKTTINGQVDPNDPSANAKGISDIVLDAKWRFYEHQGFSLAVKPAILLPTGKAEKGLGNGRTSYELLLIATKEFKPFAIHLNGGYARNEYKLQPDKDAKRKDLWAGSIAGQWEAMSKLTLVAETVIQRNEEKTNNTHPVFATVGAIYTVAENFEVNLGMRAGLNKTADDLSVLAGVALKF